MRHNGALLLRTQNMANTTKNAPNHFHTAKKKKYNNMQIIYQFEEKKIGKKKKLRIKYMARGKITNTRTALTFTSIP